jgi:hypothetical protein
MVSVWEDQTKFFHWLAGNFCVELTTLQASFHDTSRSVPADTPSQAKNNEKVVFT